MPLGYAGDVIRPLILLKVSFETAQVLGVEFDRSGDFALDVLE